MKSFDDAVKEAKGIATKESLSDKPAKPATQKVSKKDVFAVRCIPMSGHDDMADVWPSMFYTIPRIGDSVKSKSGRVLQVMDVVHADGRIELMLGIFRKTTGTVS